MHLIRLIYSAKRQPSAAKLIEGRRNKLEFLFKKNHFACTSRAIQEELLLVFKTNDMLTYKCCFSSSCSSNLILVQRATKRMILLLTRKWL